MSESERRRKYRYDRILIETDRVLTPQFADAVVYLTGAQLEMLRNVSQYLRRLETYVSDYNPGYYLTPTVADYDDLLAISADLEETLMGNPNTIFGYKERKAFDFSGTKSGDGAWEKGTPAVQAGELWLLQHCYLMNRTAARGRVTLSVGTDQGTIILDSVAVPGVDCIVWNGQLVLKAGDWVETEQLLCLDGDELECGLIASLMEVPT